MPLRETTFIERNVDAWRRLETELQRANPDPDVLRDLYAGVSDDLSYARTHYPNRSVRSYLNNKAAALALSLRRNERGSVGFLRFWTRTLPLELYEHRRTLLLSLAIFALTMAVGWGSSMADPSFPELILGADYVEMTKENIASGDPMAVYKDGSRLGGTLGIAGNNLRVALLSFVSGIIVGIGTLVILLYNGIMVGAFQQFFFAQGVGWESVLGIWTHGTIEISSIVVSAAGGLVLAKGLVWPGTLSRSRAFQLSALSGLRILAGTAPLIVIAAVIEGYVTRLTHFPTPLRVLFLAANVLFVVYYYAYRPYTVGRTVRREEHDYGRLPPDQLLDWRPNVVRSTTEVFFDVLRHWLSRSVVYLGYAALAGVLLAAGWVVLSDDGMLYVQYTQLATVGPDVAALVSLLTPLSGLLLGATLVVGLAVATERLHRALPRERDRPEAPRGAWVSLLAPWLIAAGAAYVHGALLLAYLPFGALWMRGITHHGGRLVDGLRDAWRYATRYVLHVLALASMLYVAHFIVTRVTDFLYYGFVYPFLYLNVPDALTEVFNVDAYGVIASELTFFLTVAPLWLLGFGLLFHALRERDTARGLALRLDELFPAGA